jgi:hypothetical protein
MNRAEPSPTLGSSRQARRAAVVAAVQQAARRTEKARLERLPFRRVA